MTRYNLPSITIVDQDPIIDGRKLGVCEVIELKSSLMPKKRAWCLLPKSTWTDDYIVHLDGCLVPFVMRISTCPHETPSWKIIGECILNGYEELQELKERIWIFSIFTSKCAITGLLYTVSYVVLNKDNWEIQGNLFRGQVVC